MSNPTISILSSRRLRLTKMRFALGMSSGRVADSISSRLDDVAAVTSPAVLTRFILSRGPAMARVTAMLVDSEGARRARSDQPDHRGLRGKPPPDPGRDG